MRTRTTCTLALFLAACQSTYSQVAPSATNGNADLRYSIRYSETAEFGGTLGNWHTIAPSASLDYANGRKRFPFSAEYAGGYTAALSGPAYSTGVFQHLLLSQGLNLRKWNFAINDDISYRPQSPTTGFSGIPGTGEPIGSEAGLPPSQLILTLNTHALDNVAGGQLRHMLNYRSILNVEANHDLLHFPDSNGLDTSSAMASAGVDFRLGARTSLMTQYTFSQFSYSSYDFHIRTNAVTAGFSKSWTRWFHTSAAVGPEWVNSSKNVFMPPSTGVTANADLGYQRRQTSVDLNYARQISAGSGYMFGSESDTVSASFSRELNRAFTFEMNGGYRQTSQLATAWNVSGAFGGVQASRRIGRNLNSFVNYTAMSQNSSMQVPTNVLNEMMQTLSCGIGFTKESKSVR